MIPFNPKNALLWGWVIDVASNNKTYLRPFKQIWGFSTDFHKSALADIRLVRVALLQTDGQRVEASRPLLHLWDLA